MDLCDIRTIKALLGRHGFRFSKSMGQNFLIEDWVPRDIADASGASPDSGVLEIGPGIGPLTAQLCARAGKVAAVELDRSLLPVLAETMEGFDNFTLIPGDILKLDIPELVRPGVPRPTPGPPLVCANLPYNITTPVLTALVEARRFQTITVMIQREVPCGSPPGQGPPTTGPSPSTCSTTRSRRSSSTCPPSCFLPAPKVTSAVLRCRVRPAPAVSPACGEAFFFRTVRGAFAQRRKTLLNSLSSAFAGQLDKGQIAAVIAGCGLEETIRGERLGLEEFAALADGLWYALGNVG